MPARRRTPKSKKVKRANTTRRKPAKKTAKKGKTANPWILHVNSVLKELKKTNPDANLKLAIAEGKKTYQKGQKADDTWNVSSSKWSTVTQQLPKSKPKTKPKKKGSVKKTRRRR
jgi:hypothetical protein